MNEMQIFNNDEFGEIRVRETDGDVWFVGKDVAVILGYTNPQKAIRDHVDAEDKGVNETFTPGGKQETIFINESGLYSLVMSSKLPSAKKFKRWVTSEVLPSIRQHGAYMTPDTLDQMISSPEFGIRLLTELKAEQDKNRELRADNSKLSAENAVLSPKADYFDELVERGSLMNFRETAKELGISPKKMTSFLVEKKYLYRNQHGQLLPYESKNKGYFELKESYNAKTDWTGTQTLVTVKGRDMLRQLNIL
jgi:Prophage antirepressor